MPVAVFGVGCGLGTESYSHSTMVNMTIVTAGGCLRGCLIVQCMHDNSSATAGVAIASYGEINFVVIGVILQLAAVMTESSRLTLVRFFCGCSLCCERPMLAADSLSSPLAPAGSDCPR